MNIHQQKSNTNKSVDGNKYEKILYNRLRKEANNLGIVTLNRQKKFYYSVEKPEEKIAKMLYQAKKDGTYSERLVKKTIKTYLEENSGNIIRDERKYFKRADITFNTKNKYFIGDKLSKIRIIIDTTTSARGDRIKAKAQDANVYKSFNFPFIYLIVLPNDQYFIDKEYAKPENEAKYCKGIIYDNNFCNLYKNENISLILQEKDLMNFLEYIKKRKEKDIHKLIDDWKNYYYPDMKTKRKEEEVIYCDEIYEKVMQEMEKLAACDFC